MRIGIFTDTYPPYINGVSTSIVMLVSALEKSGNQVFIVTVNAKEHSYEYEDKIIRIPGIPTGIYDYRLTGIYPIRAINKIKAWNLDVIHSHTEFGVGTFARIIAKQLDIPLVHTYHTMYEDYVHYITKGYFDGASKKIVAHLTKFYCDKTASELIVPTRKTYNLFKEKYHFDKDIHIIPTGIETERFFKENFTKSQIAEKKKSLGISPNDFVVLYVGRLAKEKNVDYLLEQHKILSKKNNNIKLLIVGSGPDLEHFKNLSKKLKIDDSVIFTDKVPWDDIPIYYQVADVFVTASLSETQGLTLIEAISSSVPVIAINDDSFKEVVVDGLNGYLFNTKKEYRNYITDLIKDNEKLNYLSRQARASSSNHSYKYFGERVLDVYKEATKGRIKDTPKGFFERLKNVVKGGFNGK